MLVALDRRTVAVKPPAAKVAAVALLFMLSVAIALLFERPAAPPPAPAAHAGPPLAFVPNAGQTDARVRYLAQGGGYGFFFTDRGVRMTLAPSGNEPGVALELGFAGAHARPTAGDRARGTVSYIGADAAHAGLATYSTITYRELWPGIDMVFQGRGGNLKYEFHVAPGADPSRIRLDYRGADRLSLTGGGGMVIATQAGTLTDQRPVSFQGATPVETRFRLDGGTQFSFALPAGYDATRPLVIDPGLEYSTFLGSSDADEGLGIAVDDTGAAYVTGTTLSPTFPRTVGPVHAGASDVFVTKLSPDGQHVEYSTFIGGAAADSALAIAVDRSRNAYVTGFTQSAAFPTTPGAPDTTYGGATEAFVTALSADGSQLLYSTFLGGAGEDRGVGIAVDANANAYVTGATGSAGFPTTSGTVQPAFAGSLDAFVTRLTPAGALVYSTFLGGGAPETTGAGIAVDAGENAYVTGWTGPGFPTTVGPAYRAAEEGFVTKLNPNGSALVYSTYLGGNDTDLPYDVAVDSLGAAHVVGSTLSTNFPTTGGAIQSQSGGTADAFVTKLTPAGSALAYSTYLGGPDWDNGVGIDLDPAGNAAVTGTALPGFPTTPTGFAPAVNGFADGFVTRLNATGTQLVDSTFLGGQSNELAYDIAVDPKGAAYVVGYTVSADFPTTTGAADTSYDGNQDVFVTKLGTSPGKFEQLPGAAGCVSSITAAPCVPAHDLAAARAVAVSPDGRHVYATGTSLTVFDRNQANGQLVQQAGCFGRSGATSTSCSLVFPAGAVLDDVALAPDGRRLYVADFPNDTVWIFDRVPATGGLTFIGGATATTMDGPVKLAVSGDGRHLYVAGSLSGSVTGFAVTATGLTPLMLPGGCVAAALPACGMSAGLVGAATVALTANGDTLYAGSASPAVGVPGDRAVVRIGRNALSGELMPVGCAAATTIPGCPGVVPQLGPVLDIKVGTHNGPIYAAVGDGRVVALNPSLTLRGCISSGPSGGCGTGRGFGGARALVSSNDGARVYAVGEGIVELDRDAAGVLSQRPDTDSCWVYRPQVGCTTAHGLFSGMLDVAGSPDDRFFYVPGPDGEISIYRRVTGTDSVSEGGGVAGTVRPTLSINLTPATFGAFVPGVQRTYEATSTANVISTAGEATLSVVDGSSFAPGRLVNGSFALASPLQVRIGATNPYQAVSGTPVALLSYAAPVSNDQSTVALRQPILANEPLRTGAYAKTLTFTLSTTQP